ncbi:MAG: hypothetical protein ACTSRO_03140 [Candidatus Heimdallarchaeaceae archaeon]
MGTLFWQEDVHTATVNFYNKIMGEFLDKIAGADASRTLGAFASLFILTIGFVITSVVLYRTFSFLFSFIFVLVILPVKFIFKYK